MKCEMCDTLNESLRYVLKKLDRVEEALNSEYALELIRIIMEEEDEE